MERWGGGGEKKIKDFLDTPELSANRKYQLENFSQKLKQYLNFSK